jgi:lipoprotein-releasing system permease protein
MNFPFFISKRYLFSRKSHSAINTISLISVVGVAIGTMALVVILSVFNGFDSLIKTLFNSFDPDIKVSLVEGKSFTLDTAKYIQLKSIVGVKAIAEVVEENALVKYGEKQIVATIKGVSDNYTEVSGINKKIVEGKFQLHQSSVPFAVVGQGVAYFLSLNLNLGDPLIIFVPKRGQGISLIPEEMFNKKQITVTGIFSIQQEFDEKYVFLPINYARKLLEYSNQLTSLEIKVMDSNNVDEIQKKVQTELGSKFSVKNRYQQQELFYKIMKSEKWAIFFILSFILIVASLNIIGSLTMLIIDKKKDIKTLSNLGADWKTIRKIFLFHGWINSFIGAIAGIILGLFICWLQIRFGFVKLEGTGTFVVDTYPVRIVISDLFIILVTVIAIGIITSWIPVRVVSRKYFEN